MKVVLEGRFYSILDRRTDFKILSNPLPLKDTFEIRPQMQNWDETQIF